MALRMPSGFDSRQARPQVAWIEDRRNRRHHEHQNRECTEGGARHDACEMRKLYERNGYRSIGRRKGYYEDGHDAERYEKSLARRDLSSGSRR